MSPEARELGEAREDEQPKGKADDWDPDKVLEEQGYKAKEPTTRERLTAPTAGWAPR